MSYRARPAGAAGEGEWRVPLALPNLEGYALELASKRLVNFFISRHRLLEDFGKHYKGEIMRNLFSGKVPPPRHARARAHQPHLPLCLPTLPEPPSRSLKPPPHAPPSLPLCTHRHDPPPLPALTTHYLPPTADGPTYPPLTECALPTYCAPRCCYTPT